MHYYYYCYCMCVCICTHVHALVQQQACGGHRATYMSPFSPSTMRVLQIELRLPSVAASPFIH